MGGGEGRESGILTGDVDLNKCSIFARYFIRYETKREA